MFDKIFGNFIGQNFLSELEFGNIQTEHELLVNIIDIF